MSSRLGSSRGAQGRPVSLNVQALRDKLGQLLNAAGQTSYQQKTEYLHQYFAKWSMNQQRMNHQQFIGALQSLHLPLAGAGEVFGALDADGSGFVEIYEFVDGVIAPVGQPSAAAPQPRSAMRNAGSGIIGNVSSAQSPAGDPSATILPTPTAERGYTPTIMEAAQKTGGSRNGSRMGSANRSPPVPSTPQRQQQMSSGPSQPQQPKSISPQPQQSMPSKPPRAMQSRPRASPSTRAAPTEVDFSEMVIDKFRAVVLNRGGSSGIHSLGRIFRIMDDDRNRRISLEELSTGLQDFGLEMGPKDLQLLLAAVDKDNTGTLSFDEFLSSIRGVVNARRQHLINMAFDVLDANGNGVVQVDDIAARFNSQGHPDVAAGRLPESAGLNQFLSQFDGVDQDGTVTRQEFLEYYKNLSASIDDDDYFELMIRNAWHIPGGQGQYENTANTRLLVSFADGSQKVVTLEHDLGLDVRNPNAVKARLRAQGVVNVVSYSTGGQC